MGQAWETPQQPRRCGTLLHEPQLPAERARACHLNSVGPNPMENLVTWMPRDTAAQKWPSSWIPTAAGGGRGASTGG